MKYTKDFARYYISYQDNLSESDKITLLNFVNESNDIQVKALLYNGEMLDEDRTTIWNAHKSGKPTIWDAHKSGKQTIWDIGKEQSADVKNAYKQAKEYLDTNRLTNLRSDADKQIEWAKDAFQNSKTKIPKLVKNPKAQKEFLARAQTKYNERVAAINQKFGYQAQKIAKKALDKARKGMKSDLKTLKTTSAKVNITTAKLKAATAKLPGPEVGKKKGMTLGKVAPTLVIAAAIATASYALYKRFISQSARACSNKSGSVKTLCMQQYKKKATQARIRNMQSQMKQCDKTKDPAKCKAKTMSTIKHLQSRVSEGTIKDYAKYHIYNANDLTTEEKIEVLEVMEMIDNVSVNTIILSEGGGVEDDIAKYYKNRNKLRKIGLRKGVKNPGAAKAKVKVAAKAVAKGGAAKKSLGSKITSKIMAYAQKKGLLAKLAKFGKVAAKTM